MIIVTTETIPGKTVKEVLGIAKGQVVQSKHMGSDFVAGLKTMVGGEIKGYTDMMNKAREIATDRMIKEAEELGADAIVGMRYGSSAVMGGASEMLAYGTAVKLK
ncbi:YbjQ family protein [Candidatus Saccharibacteria bacterium]|nr:YbjQ family protein [Candidatus Saccharibacteria bacterium]